MARDDNPAHAERGLAFTRQPPRRPRRPHEWSNAKAVTFIVTLAALRSVTLAAARAGMSRKSAYALKGRDPAFAAAWRAALASDHAACPARVTKVMKLTTPGFDRSRVTALRCAAQSPLAFARKESDAHPFGERWPLDMRLGAPANTEEGESHAWRNQGHEGHRAGRTGRRGQD